MIEITKGTIVWSKKKINVESWRTSSLLKGSQGLMETRKELSELENNLERDDKDTIEVGDGQHKDSNLPIVPSS